MGFFVIGLFGIFGLFGIYIYIPEFPKLISGNRNTFPRNRSGISGSGIGKYAHPDDRGMSTGKGKVKLAVSLSTRPQPRHRAGDRDRTSAARLTLHAYAFH